MAVDDVAYCCVEHGVAEKLESLVVDGLAFGVALVHALVHECEFVERYVVRIEAYDVVKGYIKLLFLAEGELYAVYDVTQHIS